LELLGNRKKWQILEIKKTIGMRFFPMKKTVTSNIFYLGYIFTLDLKDNDKKEL